jgi:hypothetical protein
LRRSRSRDGAGIELRLSESPEHDRHDGAELYFSVSDAEALYTVWSMAGVKGRFVAPHDTEFARVDRDGTAHPRRIAAAERMASGVLPLSDSAADKTGLHRGQASHRHGSGSAIRSG